MRVYKKCTSVFQKIPLVMYSFATRYHLGKSVSLE